jgi:class 3 adenylate cyclase
LARLRRRQPGGRGRHRLPHTIFGDPDDDLRIALINLPFVTVYFVVAGLVVTRLTNRRFDQAVGWLVDDRRPDERQHRLTLSFAAYSVKVAAVAWILAGVLLLALNAIAYTVIGDPVNEAARLSRLAREHSERVLCSEAALRRASGDESEAWRLGEPAYLLGRPERTGIALPRG